MDLAAHALVGALVGQSLSPPTPAAQLAGAALGAAAGVLPDLDAAAELFGKRVGWRWHGVALHSLPGLLVLAGLAAGVGYSLGTALSPAVAFAIALLALASHLLMDGLTSFGSGALWPFSRRRHSTRSHFMVDPVVWTLAVAGLWSGQPAWALAALAVWFALGPLLRARVARRASARLHALGRGEARYSVEPRVLAPWRWLVVAQVGPRYAWATATPWCQQPWQWTASGCDPTTLRLARRSPVLAAFIDGCDFPRCEWQHVDGQSRLLVEDLKWWLELPFRPLAFHARVDSHGDIEEVSQAGLLHREPAAPAAITPPRGAQGR
jgi:inner membrane protein